MTIAHRFITRTYVYVTVSVISLSNCHLFDFVSITMPFAFSRPTLYLTWGALPMHLWLWRGTFWYDNDFHQV